jgi:CO/xanthine dehydrogenase Mo-binding subunit
MIERLIDIAAATLGFDRVELRRRNLIPRDALPFTNGVGVTYDSGDYLSSMDQVLSAADWADFEARRADAASRGQCRGIAVANYIEVTSGFPKERAELRVCDDGYIELVVGTMSRGQGHETPFCQPLSDWLEVPFERLRFVANQYEPVSAQLLSASFMNYALPRADTLPSLRTLIMEVPASSHPHGIRPGGEGGTTPALGLVVNATVHALGPHGVTDVPMPATPLRVWQAIQAAASKTP